MSPQDKPDNAKPYPLMLMLTCKDVGRSVAFYRDVLGFELEQAWPDKDNPMWANMVLDRQSIMLGGDSDPDSPECGSGAFPDDHVAWWKERHAAWGRNVAGVGAFFYVCVDDVDAYHARISAHGAMPATRPHSEFYGIRDFVVADPDGYQLMFYTPIKMSQCQSCGMPLTDAEPGQMYCGHCADERGNLHPYEAILEGTIQGYFMGIMKLERAEAEQAAVEHLAKMPAWAMREKARS